MAHFHLLFLMVHSFKALAKNKAKERAAIEFCMENGMCYALVSQDSLNHLEDTANRVNCWKDLKSLCHNVVENDKRDG